MTRYPPQGPPQGEYSYGQDAGQGYYQNQPPYGGQQPQYGQYAPPQGQEYGQPPHQSYPQPPYGGEQDRNHAQSYYGSNEQPYQQYSNERPPHQYGGDQYHQAPPAHQQSQYGSGAYSEQQYPPPDQHHYGQPSNYGYPPVGGPEMESFKSHFDQQGTPSSYSHPPPAYGQPHYNPDPYGSNVGPEQDRGLMGALAGGAAGGFAGHKMNHGILGTIGGAVAGSLLEDSLKGKKKDKKHKQGKKDKHHKRRGSSSSSSSSSSDSGESHHELAGNFGASSRDARLEEGERVLVAECPDRNGKHHWARIDLNDCLTNTDGKIHWARGGNFRASARNVRLADGGKFLEAELGDGKGGWLPNRMRLDERITNENGRLAMV